jgi:hypothetical protein
MPDYNTVDDLHFYNNIHNKQYNDYLVFYDSYRSSHDHYRGNHFIDFINHDDFCPTIATSIAYDQPRHKTPHPI